MKYHPRLLGLAAALALFGAASPALAECDAPARDCAAELPTQCLNRMGAGVIATGDECASAFQAYLGCLDAMIADCEPPQAASSQACSEARETALWREARESGGADDLRFFLEVCPDSVFRRFAESRLAALDQAPAASAETKTAARAEVSTLLEQRAKASDAADAHRAQADALERELTLLGDQQKLARTNLARMEMLLRAAAVSQREFDNAGQQVVEIDARLAALTPQRDRQRARQLQAEAELARLDQDIEAAEAAAR